MKKYLLLAPIFALFPNFASAHCPLCTAGAGLLAIAAASLGVSSIIVGILIGAFALALGYWLAPLVKKQYIPYQKQILTWVIFLSTVIPIMPLIRDYDPLYISFFGEYGTLFHNTYTIDLFLYGSIVGALIIIVAPYISQELTKLRGKMFPYQGLTITLTLLIVASLIVQLFS